MRGCVVAPVDLKPCRLDHVDRGRHHREDGLVGGQKLGESLDRRIRLRARVIRRWPTAAAVAHRCARRLDVRDDPVDLAEPAATLSTAVASSAPSASVETARAMPNRSNVSSSRCRAPAAADARCATNASVDVRSAGSAASSAQRRRQFVVQGRGGQQARPSALSAPRSAPGSRRRGGRPRAIGPPRRNRPGPPCSAPPRRPVGGHEPSTILRLERLGDDHARRTSAVAAIGYHRHARRGQRRRDGAAAHSVTAQYSNAQRRRNTINDRWQIRTVVLFSEPRQLIDENLLAFRCTPPRCNLGPRGACSGRKCWHLDGHMANGCPQYQSKATVGYQSVPRCGY